MELKWRALLRVRGPDARRFLQGLVTCNVEGLRSPTHPSSLAFFLNAKGRVLMDAMLYRFEAVDPDSVWIECDADRQLALLQRHLAKFILRSHVSIERDTALAVHFSPFSQPTMSHSLLSCKDPRWSAFGFRHVCPSRVTQSSPSATHSTATASGATLTFTSALHQPSAATDRVDYARRRMVHGIPEGGVDFDVDGLIPHEMNVDYMDGVDFHKGCYVGQELVVRTRHQGVVRKRLMPIQIYSSHDKELLSQTQSMPRIHHPELSVPYERGSARELFAEDIAKPVGRLISRIGNVGLAIVRLDCAPKWLQMPARTGSCLAETNEMVRVFRPHWWPLE